MRRGRNDGHTSDSDSSTRSSNSRSSNSSSNSSRNTRSDSDGSGVDSHESTRSSNLSDAGSSHDDEVRGEDQEGIFLVHIPRTGGTSLTRQWKVAQRARRGKSWLKKALLSYFQYRYWIYENQAWPLLTVENAFSICMIIAGVIVYYFAPGGAALPVPYLMWSLSLLQIFFPSYVFTPMGLRVRAFARFLNHLGEY